MKPGPIIALLLFGAACGVLITWLLMRGRPDVDTARFNELLRDSTNHAQWAEKRDQQRDSMNTAYRLKDDTLSSTREQLEYALHHRPASRIADNDSLHRAIEKELGMLR